MERGKTLPSPIADYPVEYFSMSQFPPVLPYLTRRTRSAKRRSPRQGRSVIVLLVLLLLWSVCLGWGLALVTQARPTGEAQTAPAVLSAAEGAATAAVTDVEAVPDHLKAGQALYLKTCATCHTGLPPEVMPTQTWQQLLQDPQHYGAQLQLLSPLDLRVTWEYVRTYSRPLLEGEEVPYRLYQSRFFKALHPKVKLPAKAGLGSCISCHPGAGSYDFRTLSAEWQNAP